MPPAPIGNPALGIPNNQPVNLRFDPPRGKKPDQGAQAAKNNVGQMFVAVQLPDWCSPSAPQDAANYQAALPQAQGAPFRQALGFGPGGIHGKKVPDWFVQLWGGPPERFGQALLCVLWFPAWLLDMLVDALPRAPKCNPAQAMKLLMVQVLHGIGNRWLGMNLNTVGDPVQQTVNYICPTKYIDCSQAVDMYLHNYVNLSDAKGWAKGDGCCEYKTQAYIETQQFEFSINELHRLYDWNIIPQRQQLDSRVRWHGVIAPGRQQELFDSHWTPWNVSEIYRALWLLRPGKTGQTLAYTDANARVDLKRLGYEPKKIDQMIVMARTVLSWRHISQPYFEGDVSEQYLVDSLLDNGISATDVSTLLPFYNRKKDEQQRRDVGAPGPAALVKAVAAGDMVPQDLIDEMQKQGARNDQIEDAITEVSTILAEDNRADGIASTKGQFLSGEITASEAAVALGQFSVDSSLAKALVNRWAIELSHKHKPISEGQLCDWTTRGLLPVSEYAKRLQAKGYDPVDIARIIRVCGLKDEAEKQKADKANEKRRQDAEAKRLKEQQQSAAKLDAERRKQEAAQQKGEAAENKARAKVEQKGISADEKQRQILEKIQAKGNQKRLDALAKARIALAKKRAEATAKAKVEAAKCAPEPAGIPKPAKVNLPKFKPALGVPPQDEGLTPAITGNETVPIGEVGLPSAFPDAEEAVGLAGENGIQPLESSDGQGTISEDF